MKIVHVITRLIVGGAQENALLSCEGQHSMGHEVTLLTGPSLGPEGSLMTRAQAGGYRVEVIDQMRRAVLPLQDFATYRHLVARFRQLQPDIVHTHSSKAGIIGRLAARRAKVPVIIHTIHGLAFTASTSRLVNSFYRYAEKFVAPCSTRIVCVADAMRDQSLAGGVGRPEQYITIYSGMETAPFLSPPVPRDTVRQELGIAPDQLIVGTIARLFDLKGHDDLLDMAPDLCRQFPRLRFLWVGDGSPRPRFEQQIQQMGLQDRFILTGLVSPLRIPELVNAMDILVHPSRREGLARALAQGALAAKPVIAYDIDGNREALIPEQTGYLLAPFDQTQLCQALTVLLQDDARRLGMGEAGRRFVLERFAAARMVASLDALYLQCLKEKTGVQPS